MPIPLLAIAWWLAGPAKLDNDTERWLKQVHLLMLPDEEAVFRGLEDAADRQEFERIFWARRDPDPSTAANELQGMVSRAWAAADARFPSPGRKGSESGCGQVLALLGEPLEVEGREMKTRFESLPAMREGARRPEVWTYRSRPGDAVELTGGELRIAFDEECRFPEAGRVLDDLRRVAQSKVVQPAITYQKKPDGHLVRLEDLAGAAGRGSQLFESPRADFPVALEPKLLLRTQRGEAYAAGLVRADLSALRGSDGARPASLAGTVVAQAVDASGRPAPAVERPIRAALAPDGSFIASYGITLKPGRYTLRVGLVAGGQTATASFPLDVPDYESPGLKLGSLIVYPQAAETASADGPYAAFTVGALRLQPRFGNVFSKADELQAVCVLYGGQPDPAGGKASLRARFSFLKDGRPVARAEEESFDTPMAVASVGPVPLGGFAPGRYVIKVEATDAVAGKTLAQEAAFELRE